MMVLKYFVLKVLVSCQVNIVKVLNFDNVHTQLITFRLIHQKIIDMTLDENQSLASHVRSDKTKSAKPL
jgi:hypothetical protein